MIPVFDLLRSLARSCGAFVCRAPAPRARLLHPTKQQKSRITGTKDRGRAPGAGERGACVGSYLHAQVRALLAARGAILGFFCGFFLRVRRLVAAARCGLHSSACAHTRPCVRVGGAESKWFPVGWKRFCSFCFDGKSLFFPSDCW